MPKEIAEELNKYFSTVGSELAAKLPFVRCYSKFFGPSVSNSFYCEPNSANDIINEIGQLKKKKSSGPDIFNSILIGNIALQISSPLMYIFNLSLETGLFPHKLKIAKIILIYKKMIQPFPVIIVLYSYCLYLVRFSKKL